MAKKNESSFDRDFGYLMPFLDRVADAAKGLADPAARARLTELMAEEKERWAEIRALVSGAPAKAASSSTRRNATAAKPSPRASSQAETPRTRTGEPRASLTVGSLRRRG